MAELRKHRELSEIIFGLGLMEVIDFNDVDPEMLCYPYNVAVEDRLRGENKAFLMQKYGADAIQAATLAAKACDDGIAPEEWLHQLARTYHEFKVVNVMHRVTKQIEQSNTADFDSLREAIDSRLTEEDTKLTRISKGFMISETMCCMWTVLREILLLRPAT